MHALSKIIKSFKKKSYEFVYCMIGQQKSDGTTYSKEDLEKMAKDDKDCRFEGNRLYRIMKV